MPEANAVSKLLHDLNNDLSLIAGHLDLALRGTQPMHDDLRRRIENARKATQRMVETVKSAQSQKLG